MTIKFTYHFNIFLAQPVAAFLGAYITETIQKHNDLRRRIVRAERWKWSAI